MNKLTKLSAALFSAVALVAGGSASAFAAQPSVHGPSKPANGRRPGSVATGHYPDEFTRAGYGPRQVDAKVEAAYQQLFHGAPGTAPTHDDGQSIYYQLSPDMAYVEDIGNQDVRTEGMGYAMMISVQLGHKQEFDDLWNFAETYMQLKSGPEQYYFAWHASTTGKVLSTGVAPDGDQWIAAALDFASGRWGDGSGIYDYGQQAELILHAMWHASDNGGVNMFTSTSYLPLFTPPAVQLDYTDPSYALPAFYKSFALADPTDKTLWDKAYAAGEQMLQKAANPSTGLAPDYANFDGTPYSTSADKPGNNSYDDNFQEDAWRAIANANVDAEWYGVKPWQTRYSDTLESFFTGQGIGTYASRYHLDGTVLTLGQNDYEPTHAQGLVAMNSTSVIASTERNKDAFLNDLWNAQIPSGQSRYYDGMLYLLGLLYDSGHFQDWAPGTAHHGRGL